MLSARLPQPPAPLPLLAIPVPSPRPRSYVAPRPAPTNPVGGGGIWPSGAGLFMTQPLGPEATCVAERSREGAEEILPVFKRGCDVETGATTGGVARRAAAHQHAYIRVPLHSPIVALTSGLLLSPAFSRNFLFTERLLANFLVGAGETEGVGGFSEARMAVDARDGGSDESRALLAMGDLKGTGSTSPDAATSSTLSGVSWARPSSGLAGPPVSALSLALASAAGSDRVSWDGAAAVGAASAASSPPARATVAEPLASSASALCSSLGVAAALGAAAPSKGPGASAGAAREVAASTAPGGPTVGAAGTPASGSGASCMLQKLKGRVVVEQLGLDDSTNAA